jgi:magnesium chelatase family protein
VRLTDARRTVASQEDEVEDDRTPQNSRRPRARDFPTAVWEHARRTPLEPPLRRAATALSECLWGGNHYAARRALEVALAGSHATLLFGPAGVGKSGLVEEARRLLPPLAEEEREELRPVYARAKLPEPAERPFIRPALPSTAAKLLGSRSRPGEISLAHRGVLFLDDLAAYPRGLLSLLSAVMDAGKVCLAQGTRIFPAQATVMATLAVPEGKRGLDLRPLRRLPASFLHRFEILIEVQHDPLRTMEPRERYSEVIERIEYARQRQRERFLSPRPNARMSEEEAGRFAILDRGGKELLKAAVWKLHLTSRRIAQILAVSRTLADLAGGVAIRPVHLAEAIQYQTSGVETRTEGDLSE